MFPPAPPRPAKPTNTGIAFAVALFAAFVLAFFSLPGFLREAAPFYRSPGDPAALGELVGAGIASCLIAAGFTWAVLFFAFVRNRAPSRGPAHFLILLAVVVAVHALGLALAMSVAHRLGGDARVALTQMRTALADIGRGNMAAATQDVRVTAGGDVGIAETLVRNLIVAVAADRQNYQNELTGLGFPQMLKPDHLAHENLADVEGKIDQAGQVVEKYRGISQQRLAEFHQAISASAMNPSTKAAMLKGATDAQIGQRTRIWDLEAQSITESASLVRVLAQSRGGWRYQNGMLRFTDRAALAAYNAHVLATKQLSAEETEVRNDMLSNESSELTNAIDHTR